MISHVLIAAALAAVTAEFFHAISEMLSARFKAGQLDAWSQGQEAKSLPVDVNTRTKAFATLITVAIVLYGVSFAIFYALGLAAQTALVYVIVVVLATYAVTGAGLDHFHVVMGRVGSRIRGMEQ